MVKHRVGQQIKDVILGSKKASKESTELDYLAGQFKHLKQRIRSLIEALKAQHISLLQMNESRLLVAKRVAALASDCPISGDAGAIPENDEEANLDDLNSYMMVHHNLHIRQKLYCDRFSEHVVDYAVEWERIIVARVTTSLSRAERLRRNLDHYNDKVGRLKMEKSKLAAQGRALDDKLVEKLARNESKLTNSREGYESFATDLSTLIQEVTARSWKDLHPILLKLAQFDSTLASDENQLLKNLNVVAKNLNKIANLYGLKTETRWKDLESLSANLIMKGEGATSLIDTEQTFSNSRSSSRDVRSRSASGSGSKENDEVVQEVMNSLSPSGTTNSKLSTPLTSHIGMSKSHTSGAKQKSHEPSFNEMDKALKDLLHSPRSGSRSKSREFTGQSKSMNRQNTSRPRNSDHPKDPRPKSRTSSRSKQSSRNRSLFDDEQPRQTRSPLDTDNRPSNSRRHKQETERVQSETSPRRSGRHTSSPMRPAAPGARSNNHAREETYQKKWSNELVSSVADTQDPKPSSAWYNIF